MPSLRELSLRTIAVAALLLSATAAARADTAPAGPATPHVLLVLSDDLGWNDVGYHGSPIQTPTIDRIAREGIELDRFYVQPSCSPTRTALMTGKLPMALGIYRPIHKLAEFGIPIGEPLLPEHLKPHGYQTWLVGKWHLGHHRRAQLPNARGFDHAYGSLTGGVGYWDKVMGGGYDWHRNGRTLREDGYATDLLADEVERLVTSRDRSRPTFLYLAFQAPHQPNEAPGDAVAPYRNLAQPRKNHAGMVHRMDQALGRVLALYEREGMLENTIVVFSSDNGGLINRGEEELAPVRYAVALREWWGGPLPIRALEFFAISAIYAGSDNTPLPGGKMTPEEGGIRVPAAIWWPGHLESDAPHGAMMTVADVLPTLLHAITGSDAPPDGMHGKSQLASLRGGSSERPDYFVSGTTDGTISMIRWPWKLTGGKLFQIERDPYEQKDLAAAQPERVLAMQTAIDELPRMEDPGLPAFDMLWDPDFFGGPEDGRLPWPDQVVD